MTIVSAAAVSSSTGLPTSSESFVELQDVSFSYTPARQILSGVNLRIRRGQLVAVMGGSGSGKTTILRLLCGQHQPSSGTVKVDGRSIPDLSWQELFEHRRRLGMLFQFGALFTDLNVFDNVAFPLRELSGLPEPIVRDLVLTKLNAVGLRGAANLQTNELSGGMARRVALARAIALDPALALYDEPFAGLDPISLSITGQLIRRLNDALGMTSIMVTHDVPESLKIVDYVYFIAGGKVVAEGDVPSIRTSTDPFVRQFVDAKPDGPVHFHYPAPSLEEAFT